MPVDQPIILPQVEARDEQRLDVHLVRSLNGLGVCRALDAFYAADVVPVIDKLHQVFHDDAAFRRPDQGQSITITLLVPKGASGSWPCSAGLRRGPLEGPGCRAA